MEQLQVEIFAAAVAIIGVVVWAFQSIIKDYVKNRMRILGAETDVKIREIQKGQDYVQIMSDVFNTGLTLISDVKDVRNQYDLSYIMYFDFHNGVKPGYKHVSLRVSDFKDPEMHSGNMNKHYKDITFWAIIEDLAEMKPMEINHIEKDSGLQKILGVHENVYVTPVGVATAAIPKEHLKKFRYFLKNDHNVEFGIMGLLVCKKDNEEMHDVTDKQRKLAILSVAKDFALLASKLEYNGIF